MPLSSYEEDYETTLIYQAEVFHYRSHEQTQIVPTIGCYIIRGRNMRQTDPSEQCLQKTGALDQRDGSVGRSAYCSSRRPEFGTQYPHPTVQNHL